MSTRAAAVAGAVTLVVVTTPSAAVGYIHFPPMTLPKMCKESHHVRALKVEKFDKEKGVVVFEVTDHLKGKKSQITSFRHVIRPGATGTNPILDRLDVGKTAVMFSIEGNNRGVPLGLGYVFLDEYCYSVDYNADGKYWLVIRGEPGMSACYHGPAEKLRALVKDVLDGKEVQVPVKDVAKEDRDKRNDEVNDALKKNRTD